MDEGQGRCKSPFSGELASCKTSSLPQGSEGRNLSATCAGGPAIKSIVMVFSGEIITRRPSRLLRYLFSGVAVNSTRNKIARDSRGGARPSVERDEKPLFKVNRWLYEQGNKRNFAFGHS